MKKRVVFMGSADFSSIILESLFGDDRFEIVALFTQPDKPAGRKQTMTPPDTAICARRLGIEVFQPVKLSMALEQIKGLRPDYIVVAAYGQILTEEVLHMAPCINLHTSFLPKYRGAAALQTHILENDDFVGVSAILMDKGLDTGDILGYSYFKPEGCAKFGCLLKRLGYQAASLLKSVLINYKEIKPLKQIGADATYAKKLSKNDGEISTKSAKFAYKKYLAFDPWPAIHTDFGLKIKEAELNEIDSINPPLSILEIALDYIVLGFEKGSLRVYSLQAPSKNEVTATEYVRGKRLKVGDCLV